METVDWRPRKLRFQQREKTLWRRVLVVTDVTNQKSRTVSSWLPIGFHLYERMWINQKRPHWWAPYRNCSKKKRSLHISTQYRHPQKIWGYHQSSNRSLMCNTFNFWATHLRTWNAIFIAFITYNWVRWTFHFLVQLHQIEKKNSLKHSPFWSYFVEKHFTNTNIWTCQVTSLVVSIRTQAVKLHKNVDHFKYSLCENKKTILGQ